MVFKSNSLEKDSITAELASNSNTSFSRKLNTWIRLMRSLGPVKSCFSSGKRELGFVNVVMEDDFLCLHWYLLFQRWSDRRYMVRRMQVRVVTSDNAVLIHDGIFLIVNATSD